MGGCVFGCCFWHSSNACGVGGMGIRTQGCVIYIVFPSFIDPVLAFSYEWKEQEFGILFYIFCLVIVVKACSNYFTVPALLTRLLVWPEVYKKNYY